MTALDQVKAWNTLMQKINQVPDRDYRIALQEEMRRRALKTWGWVPGTKAPMNEEPELDEWEKEFLMDVRDAIEFGVDTRAAKRELEKGFEVLAKIEMLNWIREGHNFYEIPAEIKTPQLAALYNECEVYLRDELFAQVDNVVANSE